MAKAKKVDGGTVGVQVRWKKDFGERIVDGYAWNAANEFVTIVTEPEMVERLVANGDFEVVESAEGVDGTE